MNATAQQQLMPVDFKNALVEYDITDAALEELRKQSTTLVIKDISDTKGYNDVKGFIGKVRDYWVALEKARKDKNEDAVAYKRRVDTEAKRIDAVLREIAAPLIERKDEIDTEKERIKNEKILAEQRRVSVIQEAIAEIRERAVTSRNLTAVQIQALIEEAVAIVIDATYGEFAQQAELAKTQTLASLREQLAERKAFEQGEADRVAENERLAKERAELDAQRKQLEEQQRAAREEEEAKQAAIAEQQRKAQAELDEQRRKVEEQRKANEAEQQRIEQEKAEAARIKEREEFQRQAKEKAEAEAKEALAQQERARIAAQEKEAARLAAEEAAKPDIEKLRTHMQNFIDTMPEVSNDKALELQAAALTAISNILADVF